MINVQIYLQKNSRTFSKNSKWFTCIFKCLDISYHLSGDVKGDIIISWNFNAKNHVIYSQKVFKSPDLFFSSVLAYHGKTRISHWQQTIIYIIYIYCITRIAWCIKWSIIHLMLPFKIRKNWYLMIKCNLRVNRRVISKVNVWAYNSLS